MLEVVIAIILLMVLVLVSFYIFYRRPYKKINRKLIKVLEEQEDYVNEAESYIQDQHQLLNQWSEEYESLCSKNNEYVNLLEQYLHVGDHSKPRFDCINDIDDLLIQVTTKEFARHMAWKKVFEVNAKNKVIDISKQRVFYKNAENIKEEFKLIFPKFTDNALKEIDDLIEEMKTKLIKKYEI